MCHTSSRGSHSRAGVSTRRIEHIVTLHRSVDEMKLTLESQNIGVCAADKVLHGGFVAQMRGLLTGYVNRYAIDPQDLNLALSLGFVLWN